MRRIGLIATVLLLFAFLATPAVAQEWADFTSKEDRFTVLFPGQPKVETIEWPSEYGSLFPGRVYTAMRGAEKYTMTVIDYSDSEKRYYSKPRPPSFQQAEYWMMDIMGSIQYAATKLYRMKPGVKVTHDAWHYIDLVEGHQLNLTNPDGSRTFVAIYLHDNRLYILDGTVPAAAPEPGLFTQSLSFLDAEGKRVRYEEIYSNRLPPRTIQRERGGRGRGQGAGPQ